MRARLFVMAMLVIGSACYVNAAEKKNTAKNAVTVEDAALVEVVVRFVALPKEKVDAMLREDITKALSVEDIAALLKEGQGSILAAPRVVTPSGSVGEAVGGVTHRFPQDYDVEIARSESYQPFGCVSKPQDWKDYTIGPSLKVTPKRSEEGKKLMVSVSAALSWELEQDQHVINFSDANSPTSSAFLPLPSTTEIACHTMVLMEDGETVILTGGTPNRSGEEVIYALLTCKSL